MCHRNYPSSDKDISGKTRLIVIKSAYVILYSSSNKYTIENIVYFELLRRGYDVLIGKVDNEGVDFIATNTSEDL